VGRKTRDFVDDGNIFQGLMLLTLSAKPRVDRSSSSFLNQLCYQNDFELDVGSVFDVKAMETHWKICFPEIHVWILFTWLRFVNKNTDTYQGSN
jgi:hypothetical protein